jgi:hypothetical protein
VCKRYCLLTNRAPATLQRDMRVGLVGRTKMIDQESPTTSDQKGTKKNKKPAKTTGGRSTSEISGRIAPTDVFVNLLYHFARKTPHD